MKTPFDIAAALGRKDMAAALGVGLTAVGNAVTDGKFPASWYLILAKLADDKGVDCPMHVFNWKPISDIQDVGSPASAQGLESQTGTDPEQGDAA